MQEVEAARTTVEVLSSAAFAKTRFAFALSNQVRVSSGSTFAPGCVDQDSGRLSWRAMQCRMNGGGGVKKRETRPAMLETPEVEEPATAVPPSLRGTTCGRLYAILLKQADTGGGVMPTNMYLQKELEISGNVHKLLHLLQVQGWITCHNCTGRREVHLLATGQVLRSAFRKTRSRSHYA